LFSIGKVTCKDVLLAFEADEFQDLVTFLKRFLLGLLLPSRVKKASRSVTFSSI